MSIRTTFVCDGVGCTITEGGTEGWRQGEFEHPPKGWVRLDIAVYGHRVEAHTLHLCPACASKLTVLEPVTGRRLLNSLNVP